ncbi:MAG: DUF4194 domain-containing protein, partial [Actinomyces sp.]|nr:DUF4194 domain-containing protein [Actinomyces sp.]
MTEPVEDRTATTVDGAVAAATPSAGGTPIAVATTPTSGDNDLPHALEDPFIGTVSMEADTGELFPGDRGVLDPEVRRVLVRLLQRRFLSAERSPADWKVLLENQQSVESRLGDLFGRLGVDHDR